MWSKLMGSSLQLHRRVQGEFSLRTQPMSVTKKTHMDRRMEQIKVDCEGLISTRKTQASETDIIL